jgi:hypothetical protein
LLANATEPFMTDSGLGAHVGAMSMRCIVKWKARTGFGDDVGSAGLCSNPIASNHAGLDDSRWDSDLSWGAYLAHTAALHVSYYRGLRGQLDELDDDFLWGTNDLPNYGSPVAEQVPPSMNMAELSIGPHILTGGVGLPPHGSPAALYDLAGAFDLSQFQSVWMYIDEEPYRESPGLHRVLAAEALSYDTFLMPAADDPRAAGTTASSGEINAWLGPHADDLRGRQPWTTVGLVYSPDTWLRTFRPGGVPTVQRGDGGPVRDFRHQHEYTGWFEALRDARIQVRPLIAGRLQAGDLDDLDTVVLPDVQVLPAVLRDEVLDPWVRRGGTLIVTGRTGRYKGPAAMLEPWSPDGAPVGASSLTGVDDLDGLSSRQQNALGVGVVVSLPGTAGADAWLGNGDLPIDGAIQTAIADGLLRSPVRAGPDGAVDIRLHADRARGRFFIDLVNRGWVETTDQLPAAGPQQVEVELPSWLAGQELVVRTAASRTQVSIEVGADSVTIDVADVDDITTVILESALP